MTRQTQSRAFPVQATEFAGVALRRFSVPVAGRVYVLLAHSQTGGQTGKTFVVDAQPAARATAATFVLQAEWGEPLAWLEGLVCDPQTGAIEGYEVCVHLPDREPRRLTLGAADVFWWEGELFCRKARARELRALGRTRAAGGQTRAA